MKIGSAKRQTAFGDHCRSVGMVRRVPRGRCDRRGTTTFHRVVAPLARTHPSLSRGLRGLVGSSRIRSRGQDRHRLVDCRARDEADVIPLLPGNSRFPPAPSAAQLGVSWRAPRRAMLATAALVLLTAITYVFWAGSNAGISYSTAIGEQRTIRLADGSTVRAQRTIENPGTSDRSSAQRRSARRSGIVSSGKGQTTSFHSAGRRRSSARGRYRIRCLQEARRYRGHRSRRPRRNL